MTSPDSNADATSNKYNVQIGEGKGIVIGDNQHVVQQFYGISAEPQEDLTAAEATYRQKVVDTYNWLDFSPNVSLTNVALEDVFVRLALIVEKVIREPVSAEQTSQTERGEPRQQEREVVVPEPIELEQALGHHLLILGDPGAGKSTLLHWLAVTFAQRRQRQPDRLGPSADTDRLPVLIELGRLPDRYLQPEGGETPNWLQFLPNEYLSRQMAFTNTPPQLLAQALTEGRCLLLFDGLDEVANREARVRLAHSLADLARLSSGNRVIISSRPAGVSMSEARLRSQFQRCQIQPFTLEDVQRFFRFWYALDHSLTAEQQRDKADALFESVRATPATLDLATTPLLSAILMQIWSKEGSLPKRRVELYERCCRDLIEQWETDHDVRYQGALANMCWEDHLRLLTPLAYAIHSREKRTSATKDELVPSLARTLQAEGGYTERDADKAATKFLDALGLRSGLLQYRGNDTYGFPHQTFQEYLAARYIAEQPDPKYIDLVMEHLHESWWQQVHLLTIAHLGSSPEGTGKASALILTILRVYAPPNWILRSSRNNWLRLLGPGKLLPQVQLERRIAWILAREFELAARGYAECAPGGTTAMVGTVLSAQATSLVRHIIYDKVRYEEQKALLTVICQSLQHQGKGAVVSTLLEALHSADWDVQLQAAESLGQVGAGNEAVVSALLEALHSADWNVQLQAAKSLGQVGAGIEAAVSALLEALHSIDWNGRKQAAKVLGQVGAGNEAVVSALLKALHDAHWAVQFQAAESLGQVGAGNEAVVSALLEYLRGADQDVRVQAAKILGQVGAGNEAVVSALLEALHDAYKYVRSQAAASLGEVGAGNEVVVSALLEALHDANQDVRKQAAKSLGQVGAGNKVVVSALLEALRDADQDVRSQAAKSLGQVGVGNEAVVSALLKALHSADWNVQLQAAKSLGQVGAGIEAAVSALLEALHDADQDVRMQALIILGHVGVGNEAVVSALLEALHDADRVMQMLAAESLGHVGVGNEAVVSALLEYLRGADRDVRWRAAGILGQLEIKDTIQLRKVLVALNRCLYDWDGWVRRATLGSIRQLQDGRPIPGYRWKPLQKRRARPLWLKRIAILSGVVAFLLLVALTVTFLDPNSLIARWVTSLSILASFVSVIGVTLRDLWERKQSK